MIPLTEMKGSGNLPNKKVCEGCGGSYTTEEIKEKNHISCCPDGSHFEHIHNSAVSEMERCGVKVNIQKLADAIFAEFNKIDAYALAQLMEENAKDWLEIVREETDEAK